MELLNLRRKIKLAERGHDLLTQKRNALVMEFLKILERSKYVREQLNEQMGECYNSMAIASAYHEALEIENAAMSVRRISGVDLRVRNTMGAKIPTIKKVSMEKEIPERGYSIIGTSAKIDDVAKSFEKALDIVIELVEGENAIKKLLVEIEKGKRRVNALEYVLMPRLEKQARDIMFKLDEREREGFYTMKYLKGQTV